MTKSRSKAFDNCDLKIKLKSLITALSMMSMLPTPIVTMAMVYSLIFCFLPIVVAIDDYGVDTTPNQTYQKIFLYNQRFVLHSHLQQLQQLQP